MPRSRHASANTGHLLLCPTQDHESTEIEPSDFIDGWKVADESFEPTGNAGVEAERTYAPTTVVIVWPTAVDWLVRSKGDNQALLDHVVSAIQSAAESGNKPRLNDGGDKLEILMKRQGYPWRNRVGIEGNVMAKTLNSLDKLGRADLLVLFLSKSLAYIGSLPVTANATLQQLLRRHWSPDVQSLLENYAGIDTMAHLSDLGASKMIQLSKMVDPSHELFTLWWAGLVGRWVDGLASGAAHQSLCRPIPSPSSHYSHYSRYHSGQSLASSTTAKSCPLPIGALVTLVGAVRGQASTAILAKLLAQLRALALKAPGFEIKKVCSISFATIIGQKPWHQLLPILKATLKWIWQKGKNAKAAYSWLASLAQLAMESGRKAEPPALAQSQAAMSSLLDVIDAEANSLPRADSHPVALFPVFPALSQQECLARAKAAVAAAEASKGGASWLVKVHFQPVVQATSWGAMRACIEAAIKCTASAGYSSYAINLLAYLADGHAAEAGEEAWQSAARDTVLRVAEAVSKCEVSAADCLSLLRLLRRCGGDAAVASAQWSATVAAQSPPVACAVLLKLQGEQGVISKEDDGIALDVATQAVNLALSRRDSCGVTPADAETLFKVLQPRGVDLTAWSSLIVAQPLALACATLQKLTANQPTEARPTLKHVASLVLGAVPIAPIAQLPGTRREFEVTAVALHKLLETLGVAPAPWVELLAAQETATACGVLSRLMEVSSSFEAYRDAAVAIVGAAVKKKRIDAASSVTLFRVLSGASGDLDVSWAAWSELLSAQKAVDYFLPVVVILADEWEGGEWSQAAVDAFWQVTTQFRKQLNSVAVSETKTRESWAIPLQLAPSAFRHVPKVTWMPAFLNDPTARSKTCKVYKYEYRQYELHIRSMLGQAAHYVKVEQTRVAISSYGLMVTKVRICSYL